MRYTLKNWTALTRCCEDGDLEIDNNATERAIRGVAVGRNNWMFFGSDQGGTTAAVLRSFVASCQRIVAGDLMLVVAQNELSNTVLLTVGAQP